MNRGLKGHNVSKLRLLIILILMIIFSGWVYLNLSISLDVSGSISHKLLPKSQSSKENVMPTSSLSSSTSPSFLSPSKIIQSGKESTQKSSIITVQFLRNSISKPEEPINYKSKSNLHHERESTLHNVETKKATVNFEISEITENNVNRVIIEPTISSKTKDIEKSENTNKQLRRNKSISHHYTNSNVNDDILSSRGNLIEVFQLSNSSLVQAHEDFVVSVNKRRHNISSIGREYLNEKGLSPSVFLSSESKSNKRQIAYMITLVDEGKESKFIDSYIVMGHALRHLHSRATGVSEKYEPTLIAIVSPEITFPRVLLKSHGWKIIEKDIPVKLSEIENLKFASQLNSSSENGINNFMKLWGYTFTEFEWIVSLDGNVIILKKLDELFNSNEEIFYTGDPLRQMGSKVAPAHHSFLVFKPSLQRFEEFRDIIKEGEHDRYGWYQSHIGNFWGGQTLIGLIPYVYKKRHKKASKELNRCQYNCIVKSPFRAGTKKCLDGQRSCPDCRKYSLKDVTTANFDGCGTPWTCPRYNSELCREIHEKWFELREEYEKELKLDDAYQLNLYSSMGEFNYSRGFCSGYGESKYKPFPLEI